MEKKTKVPKLRFPGFTEDWEQCKFGDENDLVTGYPFESDKFSDDGIKLVRGMNVKRGYLDFSEDICMKWNSSLGLENYLLSDNDILIQMDGALIGKSYAKIKENQLPALLVQRVTRARTKKEKADSDFMYQTIQRDFLTYIGMNKTETAVPHLSLNDIRNFSIMVPNLEEQKRIGEYFSHIDHLITLHQRKLIHLQAKKKSLLQKMFPKKGERFPELRFPGFSDEWEQHNAGKIFISITDKNHPELPVLSASQELGMIKRDDSGINIQHEVKSESTYKHVMPGQFVIHLRSFQGGFAHSNVEGITSPAYTVIDFNKKEQHNDLFWKYIFMRQEFIDSLVKVTYGIRDGRSISYKDFCTLLVYYPNCAEQQQIGSFFQRFDKLITLHQRKLVHLQRQKKALLQQMFV
ncbi:MAG: restriction endonuclease subunit S [Selenomonas sp.]|nr:restriction endonuclease subunit S [Selenomonas sp.]